MHKNMQIRKGFSMLEVLIVILIAGILIGLLLAGVQQIRDAAYRVQTQNNLKQIAMGLHHYAELRNGRLPEISVGKEIGHRLYPIEKRTSVFVAILPFIEQDNTIKRPNGKRKSRGVVSVFVSPADPTISSGIGKIPVLTSYAANTRAFPDNGGLTSTFRDGTSNTICFAERYAYNCKGVSASYMENENFMFSTVLPRRATFADLWDVYPKTTGDPPVTGPSEKQWTFQTAPSISECRPWLAQTPHRGGMAVALADGSSRVIAPTISPPTFWSAVTPSSGEVLGNDW